jgi:aldose 1-epimerase
VVQYTYEGDTVGYPFPFTLTVTYKLVQANLLLKGNNSQNDRMCALEITYSALNTGTTRCPAAFGWHPYFTFTNEPVDKMSLSLPNRTPIRLNENMIPEDRHAFEPATTIALKERELDAAFAIEPTSDPGSPNTFAETVLTSLDMGVKLIVGQETGENKLNYLVCYTPVRRDSIAIEPLTSNVDAFNNNDGLAILNPGEALSGTIWVRLE